MGRPTKFSDSLAETICERIANGESLRKICEDSDMPERATVHRWLNENIAFSDRYARAREDQADFYADDIIDISDTEKDAQRARNRIDARKWKASKLAPKRYGDKLALDHGGSVEVQHKVDLSKLTNDQLRQIAGIAAGLQVGATESSGD